MAQITVYTTTFCPYCVRVKRLLSRRGLEFEEIDLSRSAEGRAELARRTGMRTFPQVLVGDHLLGGYEETQAAADSGRLEQLLSA